MKRKIKNIIFLLRLMTTHPLNRNHKAKSIMRLCKWILNTKINPYPIVYPFTEKCKLIVQKESYAALGNLYCGLLEYQEMSFVLHFLREEDFFVDIGANVGSYTILAAAHVGAETISVEPVPSTFTQLLNNIHLNRIQNKVNALNIALGYEEGSVRFTKNLGAMNHIATDNDTDVIMVPISTLDKILTNKHSPVLLKIDVEGFETEVLKGASETLNHDDLKAIIIELNGLSSRFGYDQLLIHQKLIDAGFATYQYDPAKRELMKIDTLGANNTIYIRDIGFVNSRIKSAEKVRLPNHII